VFIYTGSQEKLQDGECVPDNDAVIVENYESDDGDDILSFVEKGSCKVSYVPNPKRKTRKVLTENGVISEPKDHIKLGNKGILYP
jgi:hypothetical protein